MKRTIVFLVLLSWILTALFTGHIRADDKPAIYIQKGHSMWVRSVAISPDNKYIVSGSDDDTIRLWDVNSGKEIRTFIGHTDYVTSVSFTGDSKSIVSGSEDSSIRLWDVKSGKEIRTFNGHKGRVTSVSVSGDGNTIASGSEDKTVRLWDVNSGKEIRTIGHEDWVNSISISGDGNTIVSGSADNTVRLWDVNSGKEIRTFSGHTDTVTSVSISGDGNAIVSGSWDNTVRVWDVNSGKEIHIFKGHKKRVLSVSINGDGNTIVSGSLDGTVRLWDVKSGKEIRKFTGHNSNVDSVSISSGGKTIVSGSADETVRLWDVKSGKEIRTFSRHTNDVNSVSLSGDGKTIVSGSDDKTVRLWDVNSGKEIGTFIGHTGYVTSVSISNDVKTIVSGSWDNTVRLWDVKSGKEIRTFNGHTNMVHSVSFSGDGKTIVSGSQDNTVRLWDVNSGKEIRTFNGHTDTVTSVAFSGDGKTVVSGSWDKTVRLWDVKSGKEIRTFNGHTSVVQSVFFSGDNNTIVSGSTDRTVRLWDVKSGKEIRTFNGHTSTVDSVSISDDGQTIVSGSFDKTVRLWDVKSGKEIQIFIGHKGFVESVSFSSDGKTIVSGSRDGEIKIWDARKGTLIASLIYFKDGQWVAYTPDNYYTCSLKAEKYITFRIDNQIYEAYTYSDVYRNAEIVAQRMRRIDTRDTFENDASQLTVTTRKQEIQPKSVPPQKELDNQLLKTKTNNKPKNENITVPISTPTIIINYIKCKEKIIEGDNQEVDSPEILVNVTALDDVNHLEKITIEVNGKEIAREVVSVKRYRMKKTILLKDHKNTIKIIAYNTRGKRVSEERTIIYDNTRSKQSLPKIFKWVRNKLSKTHSWAVLIAIKEYSLKKNGFQPLPYAIRDAEAVKKYLIDTLQFDRKSIFTLYDHEATREGIQKLLGEVMPRKVGPDDRVLVYFSGHGGKEIIETENGGTDTYSYLIPIDCTRDSLFSTGISIDLVNNFSHRLPAKQALFIIDACFSGNIGQIYKSGVYKKETQQEIKNFISKKGRHVITAGRADEKAVMGAKWNRLSIYTYYLLKGLRGAADYNKNKVITLDELQLYLKSTVSQEVSMTPQLFPLKNSKGGEFVFYLEGEI